MRNVMVLKFRLAMSHEQPEGIPQIVPTAHYVGCNDRWLSLYFLRATLATRSVVKFST